MENNRKKMGVIILSILVIVALVLLALHFYGTRDKSENVLFPTLDEKTIEDIKNGHNTWYFNSDDVLFTYLSIGASIGFALALILMSSLRERLELIDVPEALKGFPLALMAAGLMSIAFTGFAGLV